MFGRLTTLPVFLLIVFWVPMLLSAQGPIKEVWTYEDYPNPQTNPTACKRSSVSSICDPNGILTKDLADDIDREIVAIYNRSSCVCASSICRYKLEGYRIGVALAKNIRNPEESNPPEKTLIRKNLHRAEVFALETKRRWQLGLCQNDIIIVYSKDSNVVYSWAGSKAAEILTASVMSRVLGEHRGKFGQKPYKGLDAIIQEYGRLLLTERRS